MAILLNNVWVSGIALAIVGTLVLFLIGNAFVAALDWREIKRLVSSGRSITWQDALAGCRSRTGVLVIESRRFPRKVWFWENSGETDHSVIAMRAKREGCIVLNVPRLKRNAIAALRLGDRIFQFNYNSVVSCRNRSVRDNENQVETS